MAPIDAIWLVLVRTWPLPATWWLSTHPHPSSHPAGVLLVLATLVKNYLKWRETQLAIQPTVGG